ncbi:MAG: beta-propeller fold lactonase family protein [Vicinamibacterales bacterium]
MRSRVLLGLPLLLFVAACNTAPAPAPAPAEGTAAPPPAPAPVAPPKNVIYVTNERAGTLTMINADTLEPFGELPLGKRPRGIVATADGTRLYVALSGSPIAGPGVDESTLPPADKGADGIGEVDTTTNRLLRVLRAGSDPEGVAVSKDGAQAFIANEDTGQVSIVHVGDGAVTQSFKVGDEPEGITVAPDGKQVWATSEDAGAVYVIDLASNKVVKSIPVGARPRSIAFLPDGSRAYVPAENEANLTVIDAKKLTVIRKIALGDGMRPMGTVVSPDGKTLFVSTGRSKMVLLVDTTMNAVVGQIEAGQRPWGIALSPDGKTLYSANGPSNDVSVIDVATRTVTKRIPAGDGPWGVVAVRRE